MNVENVGVIQCRRRSVVSQLSFGSREYLESKCPLVAPTPAPNLLHGDHTYLIIFSDHGIKPLREFEEKDPHAHMDHEKTTPVIAKHDFADGDDVPGSFFAMGPGIKHDLRLMGLGASVYDVAPTLLYIYGIEQPKQMRGRVLTEIFESSDNKVAVKK
jgi:predicted AlkP superfamily phosphohydrolase/phosphomutase